MEDVWHSESFWKGNSGETPTFKVVAAPAPQLISDRTGSDATAIWELLRNLSSYPGLEIHAITNHAELEENTPPGLSLIELEARFRGTVLGDILFMTKWPPIAKRLIDRGESVIFHHVSPPVLGRSFNPVAVFDRLDVPFVLGPAMHNVPLPDAFLDDLTPLKGGVGWSHVKSSFEVATDHVVSKLIGSLEPALFHLFVVTLERADAIIAVNEFTRSAYEQLTQREKVRVIPYGVDTSKFTFTPTPRNYEILALGGLHKRRGLQYLIHAMVSIVKDFHDARLHILGDGPQKENFSLLVKKLGLTRNVVLHGFIPHTMVNKFYRTCRLMCLPSLHESFGIVLLEAMSSGRAVVATDTVGPREIVKADRTGIIVPTADAHALAEAIGKLLADYDLSSKMGSLARLTIESRYSLDTVVQEYRKVYSEILESRGKVAKVPFT